MHQFQFAGYYAAKEKGYYRNAGFQVNVIEGKPGLYPIDDSLILPRYCYVPESRHEGKIVESQEESVTEIPSSQGETILVVEDDPAILKIIQKILEGLGYTVLTSNAPEKVMDIVKEYTGKIHLLITDVVMPKMNGHDLAKLLQAICPDLKCMFMSGYTANAIVHQGVLDKGVNFIQKPFSRKELAETVRKVLDEN